MLSRELPRPFQPLRLDMSTKPHFFTMEKHGLIERTHSEGEK